MGIVDKKTLVAVIKPKHGHSQSFGQQSLHRSFLYTNPENKITDGTLDLYLPW